MRVVTLLPAAPEMVVALGGGERLVGVSHECDYPPEVCRLPRLTATPVDTSASSAAIDAEVRRLREAGRPAIAVDAGALARLAPDVLITQDLCEVCAVADGQVHRLASLLHPPPAVLSLSARTLSGIWDDIRAVGRVLDLSSEADELVARLRGRLRSMQRVDSEPRVVCIEWLDPLYLAGHWVPDLVAAAGGVDVGAKPGNHSAKSEWTAVSALQPDLVVVMLCGFDIERARSELAELESPEARRALGSMPVWLLDGNAYTSRPGPRVVDGAERLRAAMLGNPMPGLERWLPAA
jgi:iron complex transport system substrate-binding protein